MRHTLARCDCDRCKFEHRVVVVVLVLLSIACGLGATLLGGWP